MTCRVCRDYSREKKKKKKKKKKGCARLIVSEVELDCM
jgi:hypothetical protein